METCQPAAAAAPTRRYNPLGCNSNTTLADFRDHPDELFGAHDIAAIGVMGSRTSLHRALKAGKFPKPIRLPSGRLAWRGRVITEWLDNLERECAV